jgi:hypothetical protein
MNRSRRVSIVLVCLGVLVVAGGALAAPTHRRSVTKIFSIPSGTTRAFAVPFPGPHRARGVTYSGTSLLLYAKHLRPGQRQPDLRKVTMLVNRADPRRLVYRVKIRNRNGPKAASARVRVIVTTSY